MAASEDASPRVPLFSMSALVGALPSTSRSNSSSGGGAAGAASCGARQSSARKGGRSSMPAAPAQQGSGALAGGGGARAGSVVVLKAGWLMKQRYKFPRLWQRRYFVMTSACLEYYERAEQAAAGERPLGVVALRSVDLSSMVTSPGGIVTFRACQANKEGRRRDFVLRSPTSDNMEALHWHGAISAAMGGGEVQARQPVPGGPAPPPMKGAIRRKSTVNVEGPGTTTPKALKKRVSFAVTNEVKEFVS